MSAILALPPVIFNNIQNDVSFFMMAIAKKEKAKAPGGTRRVGSDFKRLMIQSVVWRDGRRQANRPLKMRELR
ncbi:hypothetical protein HPO73_18380 [Klebsiella variicola]|uniref:hypothetical protein n=2 Tax=Klebsiella variicola TaxID=244366 RepID=UPI000515F467|nr:hypothetical protein [Klebsiella variicola]HCM3802723.1 hypothetical protein [Klebsiella variicola subsp. variicola]KHE26671.1 hypothetical protein JG24_20860 [Klebsiella variicola]MBD0761681.1 hypothetical protein [Klebsiella variicola]MBQ5058601.1 hypothetical protein [Klebsiella variicola]MDG0489055.1 hypothetical protein [Klebsiella variicola]